MKNYPLDNVERFERVVADNVNKGIYFSIFRNFENFSYCFEII